MSIVSPLVTDWITKGLKWKYIYAPTQAPRVLAAGEMYLIEEYIYPEGTLVAFSAFFNHPSCGARFEAEPDIDTGQTYTIAGLAGAGIIASNPLAWAAIPPTTPAGMFGLHITKEWPWLKTCRLYAFNPDTVAHVLLGVGYNQLVLLEPRDTVKPLNENEGKSKK